MPKVGSDAGGAEQKLEYGLVLEMRLPHGLGTREPRRWAPAARIAAFKALAFSFA
jgi:hypothetical protein